MKLRKKQLVSPKNLPVPHWKIKNPSVGISDFLGGRVTVVGTHDLCVRCIKGYSTMALTRTDAQIVRPYKGLLVSTFYNGRPPARHYHASPQRAIRLPLTSNL